MKPISIHPIRGPLRLLIGLLLLFRGRPCEAQMCSDPPNIIYGLTNTGKVVPIHVKDATVDASMNVPYDPGYSPEANAMGYSPLTGKIYYFDQENGGLQFVSFDPVTKVITNLSTPAINSIVSACVSMSGTGYYCLNNGTDLYYYDIPSDKWTLITSNWTGPNGTPTTILALLTGGDMAIDALGNLWIVQSSSDGFQILEVKTPLPTAPVAKLAINIVVYQQATPEKGTAVDGVAFDPMGQMYLSTQRNLYFLRNDFTVALIGAFNIPSTEDMYDLTSCNFPFNVLPVTWQNISATLEGSRAVTVSWQYADPSLPVTGVFNVQRSSDGAHWTTIGHESAGPADSNSYSWLDAQPVNGRNYYRVQLTQTGIAETYSPVRLIELSSAVTFRISPNPVKNTLYIQYDGSLGKAMVRIFDVAGRVVEESALATGTTTVDVGSLSAGCYFVELIPEGGKPHTERIQVL